MTSLTQQGTAELARVAQNNDVTIEAAQTVLEALLRGGGTQAQFSHPELGGMGQWSRGGMVMIGDMFNTSLKARVDRLCTDLSQLAQDPGLFDRSPGAVAADARTWWPADYGRPSTSGSQNDRRYAYFPSERRLAIESNGEVTLYDTGDHQISGVSQQQGGGHDLVFQSQRGQIRLHDFARVGAPRAHEPIETPVLKTVAPSTPLHDTSPQASTQMATDDVFGQIERLHGLMQKGILTADDFATKKTELLARI